VEQLVLLKLLTTQLSAAKISANQVTTAKIADNAITTAKISALQVTADKIAQSTITASKLATDSVGPDQLISTGVTAGHTQLQTLQLMLMEEFLQHLQVLGAMADIFLRTEFQCSLDQLSHLLLNLRQQEY
jgi:hypothetical protein